MEQVNKKRKERLIWVGLFFFLYLLVYGVLICRFSLHQDEILDYQGQANDTYIAAGRWGLYCYRLLMGVGAYPILAGVVSGIYISVALVLQTSLLGLHSAGARFLYASLYLSCIQWASQLVYSMQCDAVAFGLLCATLSVQALNKQRFVLAGIALTLSLGIYQSCGLYFLCLMLCTMLHRRDISLRNVRSYGIVIFFALLVYAAINIAMKASPMVSDASLAYTRMVQADLNQWSTFAALPWLKKVIFACHYFKIVLQNALGVGNETNWLYGSSVIPMAFLCYRTWKYERGIVMWAKMGSCFAIWIAPFALTLVMGREMEIRTALAAPLSLAAMWALFIKERSGGRWTMHVLAVVCCILLLKAAYAVTARSRDVAYEYAVALQEVNVMLQAASVAAGSDGMVPVVVTGYLDRTSQAPHALFFKGGTFDWYARHYHWRQIRYSEQVPAKHHHLFQTMPEWPAPGSVRLNCGEVLIRIGR